MDYAVKFLFILIILTSTASATDMGQLQSDTIFNFSSISVNITVLALQNFSQIQYPASPANTLEFTINGSTTQFNATTAKTIYNITRNNDVVNWSYTGSGNLIVNATVQYLSANYSLYKEGVLQYTNLSSNAGALYYTLSSAGNYSIQRVSGVPALITPTNQSTQTISTLPYTQSFSWSNEGSNQYEIQIALDSVFANLESDLKVVQNSTSIGMWTATTHYWRVRTFDGVSTYGAWSNPYQFTLVQSTSPSSDGSTGIQGIVYVVTTSGNTPLVGANVYLSNTTWSSQTVTDSNGYYIFKPLANISLYSIQAKKVGYNDGNIQPITTINGTWVIDNLFLTSFLSPFVTNYVYEKFVVRNLFDTRYSGITVNVYKGSDTTAISTATTDSMGQVVFQLIKDTYYRVEFTGGGLTSKITVYVYGKEEVYPVTVLGGIASSDVTSSNVTVNLSYAALNSSFTNLTLAYNDSSLSTTQVNFYVKNVTNASAPVQIYSQTVNSTSSVTLGFAVSSSSSSQYVWGFNATSSKYPVIKQANAIAFPKTVKTTLSSTITTWISIMLLVVLASMFSPRNIKIGAVMLPIVAGLLVYFGWFNANALSISATIVLGVLVYIRRNEIKIAI